MFNKNKKFITTKEVNLNLLNTEINLNGWIRKIVKTGAVAFLTLYDSFGSCQLVVSNKDTLLSSQLKQLTKESVVQITGTIQAKVNRSATAQPVAEVVVKTIEIINLAKPTPFLIKDETDGSEHLRLQYRYLDLRRTQMQNILKYRDQVYQIIRHFFNQNDQFVEVETPILAKPTVEGARNFLITSQVQTKNIFALPQSPQIYKQLLMNAGLSGYFQFARCFRDEDMRNDRQPEFTQLDLEVNFANQATILNYVEQLMVVLWQKTKQHSLSTPFPQIDYQTAWNRYGTDSPDLRYELFLQDFAALKNNVAVSNSELWSNFSNDKNTVVKGVVFTNSLSVTDWKYIQREIQKITSYPLGFYLRGSSLKSNLSSPQQEKLFQHHLFNDQTSWIGFAGLLSTVNLVLGKVRIYLAKCFGLTNNNDRPHFCWIVNSPMFTFSPTEKKYVATHHPFVQPQNVSQFDRHWKESKANAYDLVCNGLELGSGSERIHDLTLQKKVFSILGFSEAQMNKEFGYFLQAMEYGFPYHAGFAIGLDRLLMILTNADSVRDVIAFPKTSKATSLLGSDKQN